MESAINQAEEEGLRGESSRYAQKNELPRMNHGVILKNGRPWKTQRPTQKTAVERSRIGTKLNFISWVWSYSACSEITNMSLYLGISVCNETVIWG